MANNFNTVKMAAASEKFNLVRMEPARAIEDDLTLVSGTTYQATFQFAHVFKIAVNGQAYTLVAGAPASGQFSFDEITKLIRINLGAALTTQIVVVFYYLFFTKAKARTTHQTPTDTATARKVWLPRLAEDFSVSFNLKDVTEGFLSFGASSLVLNNEDGDFEKHVGDNDSFSNKRITIWLGLDNVENVQLAYRGFINRLSVTRKVTIEFFDEFSIFTKSYFSNFSYLRSSYTSTFFPGLQPSEENKPIYRLFAEVSYYKVINDGLAAGLFRISTERLLLASCISFSTTISTTTNRDWGTVLAEGDSGAQLDSVQAVGQADPNFTLITYTAGKKFRIGDTLRLSPGITVRVYYVDTALNQLKVTKEITIAVSDPLTRDGLSAIVIKQNNLEYYCHWDRDFVTFSVGQINNIVKVSFVNNFEATVGMPTPLNPESDKVYFRAWCDTGKDLRHGSVVKTILEEAGLTVNAASIAAANTVDLKTNFYVPTVGEGDFKPYTDVLQNILKSTFGYLSLNNNLEFEYSLFNTPTDTNVVTDRQILLSTFAQQIEYNDLRDSIVPSNLHDIIELGFVNAGIEVPRTTYLHEINTQKTYDHVLSSSSRMEQVLSYLSNRKATYSFTTKTNPDVIIGDNFKIERTPLVGAVLSRNITVVAVSKSATETQITGTDLLGI